MKTRIAFVQLEVTVTVGDCVGNGTRRVEAARAAHDDDARWAVAPELALSGYLPEDRRRRLALPAEADPMLAECRQPFDGLAARVGQPPRTPSADGNANRPIGRGTAPVDTDDAASLIVGGAVVATDREQVLPSTEGFDEKRDSATGPQRGVFEFDGTCVGVILGEDVGCASAAPLAKAADAEALPNGSAYPMNEDAVRGEIPRARIRGTGLPMVDVNRLGGQDRRVFDGARPLLSNTFGPIGLITGDKRETACRPTTRSTRACAWTWKRTRRARRAAHREQRGQAAPGADRDSRHAPRVRSRLAPPDRVALHRTYRLTGTARRIRSSRSFTGASS